MGIYAAKSAIVAAAQEGLGHPAARLLLAMAIECFDQDQNGQPARRFFGGRERQAIALGRRAPDNATPAAREAVKRAMLELVEKDLVRRITAAGNGRNAEYELLLNSAAPPPRRPFLRPVDNDVEEPQQGHAERAPQGHVLRAAGAR